MRISRTIGRCCAGNASAVYSNTTAVPHEFFDQETGKNVESLFAGANNPRSILFFDEADSLLGSRTEVKDAHDRYANLFREIFSFQGLLMIGVNSRHSVPIYLVPRCKTVSVRDHWPLR
jgi:hypothetical protein